LPARSTASSTSGGGLLAALDGWFLAVVIRFARQEGRAKRLFEKGQMLQGTVVRCAGYDQPFPPSTWEGTGSFVYAIRLEYSFRTPVGREVIRTEGRLAEDMQGQPLPEPGTPVLVMYLDDENYEVL
jgi:hypothetical protein